MSEHPRHRRRGVGYRHAHRVRIWEQPVDEAAGWELRCDVQLLYRGNVRVQGDAEKHTLSKQESVRKEESRRAQVLARLVAGDISIAEAARLLGVTPRHALRLRVQFEENDMSVLPHGNQGRTPSNQTDPVIIRRIVTLAGDSGPYSDFNTCHLRDILEERDGIVIARSTLDGILREYHLRQPRRQQPAVKRMRRERCPAEGMMIQIDGSPHHWLEDRGPAMCLIGAVDDATGKIVYATFRKNEDLTGYLTMTREIAVRYGLPASYYHDRHTILRSPKAATIEDELAGRQPQSQLQRVMFLLGVESIAAHSPQAKGRVERKWQTLQDRLGKEMRLAGISTREDANAFLPGYIDKHNTQFAVVPLDPHSAWVPIDPKMDLCYYFSTQESRVVAADHIVSWHGQCFLILRKGRGPNLAGQRIHVHVVPEGDVYLYDGTRRLEYRQLGDRPQRSERPRAKQEVLPPTDDQKADAREADAHRRAWLFGAKD